MAALMTRIEQELHVPPPYQRFWDFEVRRDGLLRPTSVLTGLTPDTTVGSLAHSLISSRGGRGGGSGGYGILSYHHHHRQPANQHQHLFGPPAEKELVLFLDDTHPTPAVQAPLPLEPLLLFVKWFSVVDSSSTISASAAVLSSSTTTPSSSSSSSSSPLVLVSTELCEPGTPLATILHVVRGRLKLPADLALDLYAEFNEPSVGWSDRAGRGGDRDRDRDHHHHQHQHQHRHHRRGGQGQQGHQDPRNFVQLLDVHQTMHGAQIKSGDIVIVTPRDRSPDLPHPVRADLLSHPDHSHAQRRREKKASLRVEDDDDDD